MPATVAESYKAVIACFVRAGIPDLCAYGFRHSRITRWLEEGVDVATVAALAGNSPRMILNTYNHVADNESRLLAMLE